LWRKEECSFLLSNLHTETTTNFAEIHFLLPCYKLMSCYQYCSKKTRDITTPSELLNQDQVYYYKAARPSSRAVAATMTIAAELEALPGDPGAEL
jgi:hypothetical protein